MNAPEQIEVAATRVAPGTPHPARRRHRGLRLLLVLAVTVSAALLLALALVPLLANHLREPLAHWIGQRLARPVVIKGKLDVTGMLPLSIAASDIVVGSGSKAGGPDLLQVERIELQLELPALLHGRVVIPRARVFGPTLTLEKDAQGKFNWGRSEPRTHPAQPPAIGSVQISAGKIIYRDLPLAISAELEVESDLQAAGESGLRFSGNAQVAKTGFQLTGQAANPLSLMQPGTPYTVDAIASARTATGSFSGTLVPLDWNSTDGRFVVSGSDLSRVLNLASLHPTPPYRLTGHLARTDNTWRFEDLHLKVGRSDLDGVVSLKRVDGRPTIAADVRSVQLDLLDIGVLAQSAPKASGSQPAQTEPRLLPSRPYDPKKLRRTDLDLQFSGRRVLAHKVALEHVTAHATLRHGELRVMPLEFGLAGGRVSARLSLDAREQPIKSALDVTARELRVTALVPALASQNGGKGKLSGRAALRTQGDSVAQALASANGTVDAHVSEGEVNALALVLTELDLGKAVKLVLFGDQQAQVSCMVASANIESGTLTTTHLVVDSSEANIVGAGRVDFRDERYALRVKADAKHPSFAKLRGPIVIEGTFRNPSVHPEIAPVAGRAAAAVALGVLVTPVAALLPLIDIGKAKDSGCQTLAAEVERKIAARP